MQDHTVPVLLQGRPEACHTAHPGNRGVNCQKQCFQAQLLQRDVCCRQRAHIGQNWHNVESRLIFRQRRPQPIHSLDSLRDQRMFSNRDPINSNMKLGNARSVKVHSAVLSTRLKQVSQIFDHYSWSTRQRICLHLLTEKSKLSEDISITRGSLRGQML